MLAMEYWICMKESFYQLHGTEKKSVLCCSQEMF